MTEQNRAAQELLAARLEDALSRAARGRIAVSPFLTPGERKQAERFFRMRGAEKQAVFWGGYAGAERVCLFLVPDFYLDIGMMPPAGQNPAQTLSDPDADAVTAVKVSGSGFRTLSHRDYLGSLLGLGLERDALGDIAVQNAYEAVVFCTRRIELFLRSQLQKVGADPVRCREYTPDGNFTDGRQYRPVSGTVASPRLDCVVAALTNLSREDAQNAVRAGLVEVEFEPEERVDRLLCAPVWISVRGYGRFLLCAFEGQTRKGRLRMRAEQLV